MKEHELWLEIRDSEPIRWYEASKHTEMTKREVEKAIFDRGFIAANVEISFCEMEKLWKAFGNIEEIERLTVGEYSLTKISNDAFEVTRGVLDNKKKKTICSGDLEAILSIIFIQDATWKFGILK